MWRLDGILSFLSNFSPGAREFVPPNLGVWETSSGLQIRGGMSTGWVITSPAVEKERPPARQKRAELLRCQTAPWHLEEQGNNNAAAKATLCLFFLILFLCLHL
jgi:hypothetical protein